MLLTSTIFEQLARQFGFQQESAHSQQEHLAMLLANMTSHQPPNVDANGRGLDELHKKLLSNYKAWARQLQATPQCAEHVISWCATAQERCTKGPSW